MRSCCIILTKNEELHIGRCLSSVKDLFDEIYIIDSFSNDKTAEIAEKYDARIYRRNWKNYSDQFNYGIEQAKQNGCTVAFRLDADELVSPELYKRVEHCLLNWVGNGKDGYYVNRNYIFMGKRIKFGGMFPVKMLRLFDVNKSYCEHQWMDEYIIVNGATSTLDGELVDDNLNNFSWWLAKHNNYASREVVDYFLRDPVQSNVSTKRLFKKYYESLPLFVRPFLYFAYRYIIRLGFLDGKMGFIFHFWQGLMYRLLVDIKIYEVRCELRKGKSLEASIFKITEIDLSC